MKKMTLAALVLVGIMAAGNALAATADLTVTATVQATCTITDGTLAFGTLDPVTGGEATANATGVSVTCTNGTDFTLSDNGGVRGDHTLARPEGETIAYTLSYASTVTGSGAAQSIAIGGTIAAGAYETKPAGVYSDTVVLNIEL